MFNKEDLIQVKEIVAKTVSESTRQILEVMSDYAKGVDMRFDRIESTMVTKDYLDMKIANLRGELVLLTRKEDTKLVSLVGALKNTQSLPIHDAKKILAMEPFPRK